MWEASGLGSEDMLWATTNFIGGIAGHREAVCGALSGAAVYLGLKHRVPLSERDRADQARKISRELALSVVLDFNKTHGGIICGTLVGVDFSNTKEVQRFRESGEWLRKCTGYVNSVISKLYSMEV